MVVDHKPLEQQALYQLITMQTCLATAAVLAFPTLCFSLKLPTGKAQSSNIVDGAYLIQLSTSHTLTGRDTEVPQTTAHEAFHKRAETSQLSCEWPLPSTMAQTAIRDFFH